ncbi:conserved hypothetical protein [Frankia sp. Hr75.2]|nr:conserved hypothetical protein [Frankia sp. Hr75.2]
MLRDWARSRWTAVVTGLLAGAGTGLAVYQGSRLEGQSLFILCGTTAGGVAALVIHGYASSIRLTELTLSIPQFSNAQFVVTKDNKAVAWRLFIEMVTRVSLQPLDQGTGKIREAMNSLYALFGITRQTLAEAQPSRRIGNAPTVEHLAVAMLNKELRPFLSRWHPRLQAWENEHPGELESAWPDDEECRQELSSMQARLIRYAAGFGELSGVTNVQAIMGGEFPPG